MPPWTSSQEFLRRRNLFKRNFLSSLTIRGGRSTCFLSCLERLHFEFYLLEHTQGDRIHSVAYPKSLPEVGKHVGLR